MPVKFLFNDPLLRVWILLHQTFHLAQRAEDAVFAEGGLTPPKHAALMAMKHMNGPATPSNVANWLDRNTNSMTTLVDRMEKDGLVKRVRDRRDRRSIRLVVTKAGEECYLKTTELASRLVREILSDFSRDELRTFITMLEKVQEKEFDYLNPGVAMEEIKMRSGIRHK